MFYAFDGIIISRKLWKINSFIAFFVRSFLGKKNWSERADAIKSFRKFYILLWVGQKTTVKCNTDEHFKILLGRKRSPCTSFSDGGAVTDCWSSRRSLTPVLCVNGLTASITLKAILRYTECRMQFVPCSAVQLCPRLSPQPEVVYPENGKKYKLFPFVCCGAPERT